MYRAFNLAANQPPLTKSQRDPPEPGHKKRCNGLSQEYPVKKLRHPPEVFPFKPQITKYNPETDSKKRLLAQRLLRETQPHDKSDQLRSLINLKR